jgi:hypothetical protein
MPFNTSGIFNRIRGRDSWKGDAADGTPIKSDLHDINDNDIADALSQCINKNGYTTIAGAIPFNNQKITNLGTPTDPGDAVNKDYADNPDPWPTSRSISGADAEGRLNFTNVSGANGITWSNIGAAWLAKKNADTDEQRDRVVLNTSAAGTGADVIAIDKIDGNLVFPTEFEVDTNLYLSPDGVTYRTPVAGTGGILRKTATALTMLANSVATTLAKGVATLETWFTAAYVGGNVTVNLNKKASGGYAYVGGQMGGKQRWVAHFGNSTAESATDGAGSDFSLVSYNNAGTPLFTAMTAYRRTGRVDFPVGFTGTQNFDSYLTAPGIEGSTSLVLAVSTGSVLLRPYGFANTASQAVYETNGDFTIARYMASKGYAECPGTSGNPSLGQIFNSLYVDSTDIRCYVGTSLVGRWTPACDHRIKKDVAPLPGTWDAVKKLRPVTYTDKAYGDEDSVFRDGDTPRIGFLAHELQEALGDSAATGVKDGDDLQGPDVLAVVAALTAALQEAQLRIEALEARP